MVVLLQSLVATGVVEGILQSVPRCFSWGSRYTQSTCKERQLANLKEARAKKK